jgi:hypothetical protein
MKGEGLFDGVCSNQCKKIYQNCKNDLFIIENNGNKLRPCLEADYFCWKLKDIVSHFNLDIEENIKYGKIC